MEKGNGRHSPEITGSSPFDPANSALPETFLEEISSFLLTCPMKPVRLYGRDYPRESWQ